MHSKTESISELFAVWSRGQSGREQYGSFDLNRDLGELIRLESSNTVLIKIAYWIGL